MAAKKRKRRFKTGDVVGLRSGGERWTVEGYLETEGGGEGHGVLKSFSEDLDPPRKVMRPTSTQPTVACVQLVNGKVHRDAFPEDVLEPAKDA